MQDPSDRRVDVTVPRSSRAESRADRRVYRADLAPDELARLNQQLESRNTELQSRLDEMREDAELREIGVTGNGDGLAHVQRSMGVVANVIADGPSPAWNHGAAAAGAGTRLAIPYRAQPGMIDATPLLRIFARRRLEQLARLDPLQAQRDTLSALLRRAANTRFGSTE